MYEKDDSEKIIKTLWNDMPVVKSNTLRSFGLVMQKNIKTEVEIQLTTGWNEIHTENELMCGVVDGYVIPCIKEQKRIITLWSKLEEKKKNNTFIVVDYMKKEELEEATLSNDVL